MKRRFLCHPCLLHRVERRSFQTIFKELAVENKHAQFVALFELIAPFVTKQGSQQTQARECHLLKLRLGTNGFQHLNDVERWGWQTFSTFHQPLIPPSFTRGLVFSPTLLGFRAQARIIGELYKNATKQ